MKGHPIWRQPTCRPPQKRKRQNPAPTNAKDAEQLFKAGQRILAGEDPLEVFPKEKPAAAAPKPLLCAWQEKIADAISEMITTGSTDENLTKIIGSVIDNDYRKRFGHGPDESRYKSFWTGEKQVASALKDLVKHQETRRVVDAGPERDAANVVQRIREAARQQCSRDLQGFLDSGSPEEHRFWRTIMLNWRSAHLLSGGNDEDMGIASAFQEEIDRSQLYMRVPEQFFSDTWEYVRLLMKTVPTKESEA